MHIIPPEELGDEILLSMVEGVGSLTHRRLLEAFGDATAILAASPGALRRIHGISEKTALAISTIRRHARPDSLIRLCRSSGIEILSIRDLRYPEAFRNIDDPPPLLYIRGALLERDAYALAVIGTRRMTPYGRRMAARLSESLSRSGLTIISGLAKGIDGIAHEAALRAGGRTIAVLGSGHQRLFPAEHAALAEAIARSGAVLGEYHPLHEARKWTFPQRNRLVAALAVGVLVIEAPKSSGTMITARLASEQGRDIFAVPGPADHPMSQGCHQLIRDGATLVETAEDVLEQLGPLERPVRHPAQTAPLRHPAELTLNEIEREVLALIGLAPTAIIDLPAAARLAAHQVLAALGTLETKGIIRFEGTGKVVRL